MQLSHSRRFIFVHIFKTAGTSIRAALERYTRAPGGKLWSRVRRRLGSPVPEPYPQLTAHARAAEIREAVSPEVFSRYFKFAFVRNPWDWQVSWYHYILQNHEHHEHEAVTSLGNFADQRGSQIVDFVGRFESIESDFAHVCAVANIGSRLPHLNRSRHADYRCYYSDRACRLLEQYSKDDIEYFGSSFDPAEEALPALPSVQVSALSPLVERGK
jgi:Sulfotransferase family